MCVCEWVLVDHVMYMKARGQLTESGLTFYHVSLGE